MSYTLPAAFISELSAFIKESLDLAAPQSKKLEGLIKEFIHGDAAPYAIKIARNSSTLSENSGKIIIVVPAKGPVFIAQNNVNLKNLKDIIKSATCARITEKINATYGAGYNIYHWEDYSIVEDIEAALNKNNHECVVIKLVARPETAYVKFLKEAAEKYPSNTIAENARLWAAHKASLATKSDVTEQVATLAFPEPDATLVLPDPDATLVVPEPEPEVPKKKIVRRK